MILNNSNWLDYALENYNTELNLKCEIYDDLKSINIIKRSINLYNSNNDDNLQLRIILNNILVLVNVFGVSCSFNILLYKLNKEYFSVIKTFYYFLRLIDNEIKNIKILIDYDLNNIEIDRNIYQKLLSL